MKSVARVEFVQWDKSDIEDSPVMGERRSRCVSGIVTKQDRSLLKKASEVLFYKLRYKRGCYIARGGGAAVNPESEVGSSEADSKRSHLCNSLVLVF